MKAVLFVESPGKLMPSHLWSVSPLPAAVPIASVQASPAPSGQRLRI